MKHSALLVTLLVAQPLLAYAHDEGAPAAQQPANNSDTPPEDPKDDIPRPPPTYQANNVTVDEKLGARVPMDAKFRRQDGNVMTLGAVLAAKRAGGGGATGGDDQPTILTFNYSDCPMLCNLQLNGLTATLPLLTEKKDGANFWLGEHYRIVTIDLEPNDSIEKLVKMREKYLARFPQKQRETARAGWTFLVAEHPGDGSQIKKVADAVGFTYTYIKERAEWAHPAALIFLSARGMVTRYVYGIEFAEDVMRDSIFRAGASEPSTAVGFMNRCYHFDPGANDHSHAGVMALRIGAAGFVVLLLSGLGMLHTIRKNKGPHGSEKENRS